MSSIPAKDRVRILHMIEAGEQAIEFLAGRTRTDFDLDTMLCFAVIRAVEIVGEDASRMSRETRDSIPQVPWNDIIAMRNILVHAYFNINRTIVWQTATEEVPKMLAILRSLEPDQRE